MGKSFEEGVKVGTKLTKDLLKNLEVKGEVKGSVEDDAINIQIEGEDLGILIGYHGESLEALQLILGLMVNNNVKSDEWLPVNLDAGGWRKDRREVLSSMVEKAAGEVETTNQPVELPPMPASQRRVVHVLLTDHKGLTSESVGDEPNRKVVIRKA